MSHSRSRSRLALCAALAALPACSSDPAGAGDAALRPSVLVGSGDGYPLLELALDSATYAEMVGDGSAEGVVDSGPSASGAREVTLVIDPYGPAAVYERLLVGPGQARTTPDLAILLGDGEEARIGLLLPAVQKVRAATVQEDGTMSMELAGAGEISSEPQPAAFQGGVRVAQGDVNGYLGGNGDGADPGASMVVPLLAAPRVTGDGDGLAAARVELGRPDGGVPSWFDFGRPTWAAIDVRAPGGPVLHRFRIGQAIPEPDDGRSITLGPARAWYIRMGEVDGEVRDGAAERELVASYPTYSGRDYLVAQDALTRFTALGDPAGGGPTLAEVREYWKDEADIVAGLARASAHAADYHGLLCQVALPTALAAAREMSARRAEMAADPAWALASAVEALRALPLPIAHGTAGGALEVESACRAAGELAALAGALEEATGAASTPARLLASATAIPTDPRELDRALTAWIALVDRLVVDQIDDGEQLAAARAKADILIEALSNAAEGSAARWEMAQLLVAP